MSSEVETRGVATPAEPQARHALLSAECIRKSFGGIKAVTDFSIELHAGEIVGLIGPNGAGKTTVFNLLTGVYKPDGGVVRVCGKDTARLTPDRVTACGVARTFQNIRLFKDMSVLENVKAGFHVRQNESTLGALLRTKGFRAEEERIAAKACELLDLLGLGAKRDAISRNLPYGEQRKLEIARALATQPRVLLLDEPAAGMNESESAGLRTLLEKIRAQFELTILLIEHDMPFVMGLASRILVLDRGVTIARGTPEQIRSNPQVIEAYLGKEEGAA